LAPQYWLKRATQALQFEPKFQNCIGDPEAHHPYENDSPLAPAEDQKNSFSGMVASVRRVYGESVETLD
jgi:hypothetical protein